MLVEISPFDLSIFLPLYYLEDFLLELKITKKIVRDEIKIENVSYKMIDNYAYINISFRVQNRLYFFAYHY